MSSPIKFLIETKDELVKVTWPTRNEVTKLTMVVLFVSIIVSLYIGGLDFIFTKLLQLVVK
jgi:preprotein translocase subunit SecE